MVKHFVIMSSSYADGARIALDITGTDSSMKEKSLEVISSVKHECGKDVSLSTHFIETADASWESVQRYDPFFESVKCIQTKEEFIRKIKKDRALSGLDVANYILSQIKCTHLSLEKLVYFAYAEYLCDFSKKLFQDRIYAFSYGPVIESVYQIFKKSGSEFVEPQYEDDMEITADVKKSPSKSRILFAEDGIQKLQSIDRTIQKYGRYSARELVSITHRSDSPWSHVDSKKQFQLIPDELIIRHHAAEVV